MKKLLMTAALLSSVLVAGVANGQAYRLTYASPTSPMLATINITTSTTLNSVGGYNILSASGTVDGNAIVGLITNPNAPNVSTSADGLFTFDNVFFKTAPAAGVDNAGLYFSTATNQYNLFSDTPASYELYAAANGGYTANSVGTLGVAAVPEPATWGMMVVGFGMVGFGLRSRRKQQVRVTYA